MKPGIVVKRTLFFSFSSFLLLFTTKFPLLASAFDELVSDIEGNGLFPGAPYYMVPFIVGPAGGGLKPGSMKDDEGCEAYVVQENFAVHYGVAVEIDVPPKTPGHGFIVVGGQAEIAFSQKPNCANSSKWVIVSDSEQSWVGIGGPEDHPGKKLVHGFFKILKSEFGFSYRLVFCPRHDPHHCPNIGIHYKDGARFLVANPRYRPFEFVFVSDDGKSVNYIKQVGPRPSM